MVNFSQKSFFVDGKKTFFFGGEVHYFRIPKADWEDRILKVKDAGGNLISTYIPWIIHEQVQGDIDVIGKNRSENDLGYFLSLIKKHKMYCMVRLGPYIMSEIKNEGLPEWLYTSYDDIIAKGKDGNDHPSRSVFLLHKGYLEFVDKWYKALGEVIKPYTDENNGPVVMAQLDNEIGMMHWCCGMGDYSKQNLQDFKQFLSDKYKGNISSYYSKETLDNNFSAINEEEDASFRFDFCLYHREYFKRYFEVLKEKCYKYVGELPVVLNVHGFDSVDVMKRGKQYPIGVSQLSSAADVSNTIMAGDYYIGNIVYDNFQDIVLANAFTSAVQSKEQPLFSAEFQGGFQVDMPRMQPTTYDLTTRICVANGMNSVNYYMFAGGTNVKGTDLLGLRHSWQAPVDTDGSLNPQYKKIAHLGNLIKANEQPLLGTRQESVVHLGLIPDYYMTEYQSDFTREMCQELKLYREELLFEGMGKGMSLMNIIYDGYDLTTNEPINVNEVKAMAVFSTRYMDEAVQKRLIDYVEAGGKMIIFPTVPVMDMLGNSCRILADWLNCNPVIHDFGFAKNIDDVENLIIFNSTELQNEDCSFAMHDDGFTCGFEKNIGKGKVVAFGIGMSHDYFYRDQVILNLFKKLQVEPLVTSDSIKDKLLLSTRVGENNDRYLFINNIDEFDKTTKLHMDGNELFDGKQITVRSRSGLMLPLNIQLTDDIFVKYSTAEIIKVDACDNEIILTLALTQPQDEIVIKTNYLVQPSDSYEIEKMADYIRIKSLLHGYIENKLNIMMKL